MDFFVEEQGRGPADTAFRRRTGDPMPAGLLSGLAPVEGREPLSFGSVAL